MNSTLTRTLTALCFLIIVLIDVYYAGLSGLRAFIFLITFFLQYELANMVFKRYSNALKNLFILTALSISFLFCFAYQEFLQFWPLIVVVSLSIVMYLNKSMLPIDQFKISGYFVFGIIYVSILPSIAVKILDTNFGIQIFITAGAVTFMCDILAYFVGRRWGQKKILPTISPNKTWSGAVGGLVGCLLISIVLLIIFKKINRPLPTFSYILIGLFAGILGQIGDFFESMVKRAFDQKDSSGLLPGHGGFLDRFDALLFVLPLYYAYAIYLEKLH